MTQSKRIAVTGGIGSGKSTVLGLLKKHGYPVFSCDEIYDALWEETGFSSELAARFPAAVFGGRLDRAALAKIVFSDSGARNALNAFTHPLIMERLLASMEGHPLSFAEVPLLFEGNYQSLFDGVIVVMREKAARIAAVQARSGLEKEEILVRMESQFGYDTLPGGCTVLPNDGPISGLEERLLRIVREL